MPVFYILLLLVFFTLCSKKERRFLVIDLQQLILVEPDTRRLGWGVVKFVGFLQVHVYTFPTKNMRKFQL